MKEEFSRVADFVSSACISKEDLDLRTRLAKYFSPILPLSGKITKTIKDQNRELFANFDRLLTLVEIYVGMEERGAILGLNKVKLSSDEKQEWVHLISYAVELALLDGQFKNEQEFQKSRKLFNQIFTRNNGLLNQDPPNVFFSLGQVLRNEIGKMTEFTATSKMIREVIKLSLENHPDSLGVLVEGLRLPWLVKKTWRMAFPNFSYEKKLWKKGYKYVAGVDEVGRGAFAGPVVVGAVIWPRPNKLKTEDLKLKIDGVNDSKLLKPRFREQLAKEIKKHAIAWDVTEVGVSVINKIGIGKATEKAMRKTIKDLTIKGFKPDYVLIDYFYVPYLKGIGKKNQLGIKRGDQKSFSIAAASILAKVHRDRIMRSLARKPRYKKYLWGKNKGYGTEVHLRSILRYGLTRYHRKKFIESWRKGK